MSPYRPVDEARTRKYVTLSQASAMTGGLLSPGSIRDLVRAGRIPGAIKAGHRYFLLRQHVGDLIQDMSVPAAAEPETKRLRAV